MIENRRLDDGRIASSVHHLVRDPEGRIRTDEPITHAFLITDGLLARMDVL